MHKTVAVLCLTETIRLQTCMCVLSLGSSVQPLGNGGSHDGVVLIGERNKKGCVTQPSL